MSVSGAADHNAAGPAPTPDEQRQQVRNHLQTVAKELLAAYALLGDGYPCLCECTVCGSVRALINELGFAIYEARNLDHPADLVSATE